jgi:glycosyltransferase involved in cell wall biosynthesis
LKKLLLALCEQETDELFTISISIIDNDRERTAKPIVDEFVRTYPVDIRYVHVPERNLALLRNYGINNARGDYVAFIDDDEFPTCRWLLLLHRTLNEFHVAGALGPIVPSYRVSPPAWILKGKFCERPRLNTGTSLQWGYTRTGNALVKMDIFSDPDNLFDTRFKLGGEDVTLFEKLINKGFRFVWCDEAIVFEDVPVERLKASYFSKRSRLHGFISYSNYKDTRSRTQNFLVFLKSLIASGIYLLLMPPSFILGYHHFVYLLIRFAHYRAVILTYLGLLTISERDI